MRLADKGNSNGGLYWDVNVITLFAFKKMKHLAIMAARLRKPFILPFPVLLSTFGQRAEFGLVFD